MAHTEQQSEPEDTQGCLWLFLVDDDARGAANLLQGEPEDTQGCLWFFLVDDGLRRAANLPSRRGQKTVKAASDSSSSTMAYAEQQIYHQGEARRLSTLPLALPRRQRLARSCKSTASGPCPPLNNRHPLTHRLSDDGRRPSRTTSLPRRRTAAAFHPLKNPPLPQRHCAFHQLHAMLAPPQEL